MNAPYWVCLELDWGDNWQRIEHMDFCDEDFDDDEQLCQALASSLLEAIKSGRKYIVTIRGEDNGTTET